MGNVQYFQCDLCQEKTDPKKVAKLTLTKSSWKKARVYDVCPKCTKLITSGQLGQARQIMEVPHGRNIHKESTQDFSEDPTPDDIMVEERMRDRTERGRKDDGCVNPHKRGGPDTISPLQTNITEEGTPVCPHMNKSRVENLKSNNPYRVCRDCGEDIPLNSAPTRSTQPNSSSASEFNEGQNPNVKRLEK